MKNIFLFLLLFLLGYNLIGQTITFSGTVSSDTTWDVDTVKITGDVVVADSITLNISPGAVLEFQGDYSLTTQGRLLALGEESDNIIFTINDTTGFSNFYSYQGWEGLVFDSISSFNDSSILEHCVVEYSSRYTGGGIYINGCDKIRVSNSIIQNNVFFDFGGGIYLLNSDLVLTGSIIRDNLGDVFCWGSGVFVGNSTLLSINNEFYRNVNGWDGSGTIYASSSDLVIVNNILQNNKSAVSPGIKINSSNALVTNSLITSNLTTLGFSNGVDSYNSDLIINNSTICSNYTDTAVLADGAGIRLHRSTSMITNTILYYNKGYVHHNQVHIYDTLTTCHFYNCNIQGGVDDFDTPGFGYTFTGDYINNIDSDPMFVDTANLDFNLQGESPCINRGTPDTTGLNLPIFDLNMDPRIVMDTIDIGAYEYQGPLSIPVFNSKTKDITCYPNPVTDNIFIENKEGLLNHIYLYTTNGKLVLKKESRDSLIGINLNDLKAGTYLLSIKNKNSYYNELIVVQ